MSRAPNQIIISRTPKFMLRSMRRWTNYFKAYSSPIVMVKKKTGKWRLCVDFRQIDKKSVKDAYPMPRIKYIHDQLREARFVSSLGLREGYWQIPLEETSTDSSCSQCQERAIPVEGNAFWIALGIRNISTCLGLSNWTGDVTT